jgi:hypothetical protein
MPDGDRWTDEQTAALIKDIERLAEKRDYTIDLQRIIEDLCNDRSIRVPKTTARFHYEMAVAYRERKSE